MHGIWKFYANPVINNIIILFKKKNSLNILKKECKMRREAYNAYSYAYPDENKMEKESGPDYTVAIADIENFKHVLDHTKIVVVYVWAPWCRACRPSNGLYLQLAQAWINNIQNREIVFVKDDIDHVRTLHKRRVEVVPTFILYHDGREVDRVVGNDLNKLNECIRKWIQIPCIEKNTFTQKPIQKFEKPCQGRCPIKASENGPKVDGVS